MILRCKCRFLAAAFAAASLLVEVRAQVQYLVPPNTPGVRSTDEAIDSATAGIGTCSCDCCQATQRTETVSGEAHSCAVVALAEDGTPSTTCPEKCEHGEESGDVVTSDEGGLQYSRFCHYNCLPQEESIGAKCRMVTQEEHQQLLTSGGNGKDPASLNAPVATVPKELEDPNAPPEPPQLVDQQALNDIANAGAAGGGAGAGAGAGAGDGKEDEEMKDTGALVAESSGKQALAAAIEARLTEAEASSAQSVALTNTDMKASRGNGLLINAAKAQVQAAEVRAGIYAKSAAKAAAKSQALLKDIQDIPKKAAEYAAAEAKKEIQVEVNKAATNVAIVKARLAGPGLPVPLAEAAVRAAQPYYNVMNKAIAMGNLYAASAHTLQDEAMTMQQQSRDLASQAVLYQTAGKGDLAEKLMAQARGLLRDSMTKSDQAEKDFAVAENVRKSVPNYQANAAAASARATSIANPAGQPPPAVSPTFLQMSSHSKLRSGVSQ